MDKLKPVLTYSFWIVFVIALLVPVVGWWSTTSALEQETESRISTLNGLNVPPADSPNDTWSKQLGQRKDVLRTEYEQARWQLWNAQQDLKTWPPIVQKYVKGLGHREPIRDITASGIYYRESYEDEVEKVVAIVDPYDPQTEAGKLVIAPKSMPHLFLPQQEWNPYAPSDDIWSAQEDVWLMRSIMKAIANVNASAENIAEAPVREITKLELRGGNRDAMPSSASESTGSGGAYSGGRSEQLEAQPGLGFGQSGGGGARGGGVKVPPVDFELDEEIGSAGGAARGGSARSSANMEEGVDNDGAAGSGVRRYVDDDENLPYLTRAFYLKVRMRHEAVPRLTTALVAMKWPTEILRVQMSSNLRELGLSPRIPAAPTERSGEFATLPAGGGRTGGGSAGGGGGDTFSMFSGGGMENAPDSAMEGNMQAPDAAGFDFGSSGGFSAGQQKGGRFQSAMSDPLLADVVIAGLMKIYRKPDQPAAQPDAQQQQPAEGTPPNEAPAREGSTPPNPVPPAAANADSPKTQAPLQLPGTTPPDPASDNQSTEPQSPTTPIPDDSQLKPLQPVEDPEGSADAKATGKGD